ncbi:hypothetical protein ESY87_09840 [Subsaximicrobium wynnwilliamsii]|uniref:hypothetical protein n=1 Tax=Subsaximicrobium wynnwilliamsii TaxID=291179 RepID=UPI0011BDE5C9|nr:hypothetical protein [Subsaximicrobium wynnwilliamsii]TXD83545.1 hypothetical protein ESY87_09840 [Subsaximicrobium wynnwilliamsii]TXE03225.1 hypothetical protein ESY88_09550 [Subsaximicrobium wynnwilliamsii]
MNYITVELKYPPKNKSLLGEISNLTVDAILKELKSSALEQNKNIQCDIHKDNSKGTIIISLNTNDDKKIELTNFCCDKFKNKVRL